MKNTSRPMGRFFYWWAGLLVVAATFAPSTAAAGQVTGQDAPPTTVVSDTIYRADGTPAQGTLLIRWPAFTTSEGFAVAAGTMSVKIGAEGTVSIPLAANTGAEPAGTAYKVTLKLDDGTTSEETWVVPEAPTVTIAAVRARVSPVTVAAQFVSRDYVDTKLAQLSTSADVVHTNGDETIGGVKQFTASPLVPDPLDPQAAASKSYVDAQSGSTADAMHLTGDETVEGIKTFTGEVDAKVTVEGINAVDSSSAPVFDGAKGNVQRMVLTGNISSASLVSAKAGQRITFVLCQDAAGGHTFQWPSNVKGGAVLGSDANKCSTQEFIFDGVNAYAVTPAIINQ